ncbi:COP9 signalosome complex subunit 8 [Sarcoptes scabiei]|uniref:COP9 signalosome complex subunit 8 n=2 Tax=Sarcoptes scabiei TaxID=52283 RepID=A0A834R1N9_SARSC|nr:COP9 signalosome complex subunit 8 [Sarcoptes scabiei]UXI14966.1 hypothetical protein NH340_JMT00910 [Sarcoptes scabiei]
MNGKDAISSYKEMAKNLEHQELKSSLNETVSPLVYGQLLAIYILINDLPNAKLIWKRIPKDIKENHKEIVLAWNVGVKIIQRDWAAIYPMIDSVDWPNHLKNIMSCLKESTRERMLISIGKAYSSIKLSDICAALGLDKIETIQKIKTFDWEIDEDGEYVKPKRLIETSAESSQIMMEELTSKLTDFVSFLEN